MQHNDIACANKYRFSLNLAIPEIYYFTESLQRIAYPVDKSFPGLIEDK